MTALDRRLAKAEHTVGRTGQRWWDILLPLATDKELEELEAFGRQAKRQNASELPGKAFRRYHAIVARLVTREGISGRETIGGAQSRGPICSPRKKRFIERQDKSKEFFSQRVTTHQGGNRDGRDDD